LGWLESPDAMTGRIEDFQRTASDLCGEGFTDVLLLGMGGSSLAPEVMKEIFGFRDGYLNLGLLDSTDPGAVLYHARRLDLDKTLFIVATKSGTTTETLSFFKYFYELTSKTTKGAPGGHFVAITDPESSLVKMADRYSFRASFLNDPDIGGRYSALSCFGLVPVAFAGIDVKSLLSRSLEVLESCKKTDLSLEGGNPGVVLGAVMGVMAKEGHDKLTVIASPQIAAFGNWLEQLVAESTGKEGKGILPVLEELPGDPSVYGGDRLFIYLKVRGDESHDAAVDKIEQAGHPVIKLYLDDLYDIGGQFFLWEMATAVACHLLGANPFDQPDVELAKRVAREMMDEYAKAGVLPVETPVLVSDRIAVYGDTKAKSPEKAVIEFLAHAVSDGYVSIQSYIRPSDEADYALCELKTKIRDRYKIAATYGYGPRYLHSTGQLHKGDAGRGLFVQFTADKAEDAAIPHEEKADSHPATFGVLEDAQAMGDRKALTNAGRRVIRFHLKKDIVKCIESLAKAL
jgi:glucose-6-phosphate isomerase